MSYIENMLEPDERIIHEACVHWLVHVPGIIFTVGAVGAWFWLDSLQTGASWSDFIGLVASKLALVASIGGIVGVLYDYLRTRVEEYVVTNKRVIRRRGVLRRDIFVYPLFNIETIDVKQSVAGRLFGYGDVEIHTAAEYHGTGRRRYVTRPEEWRRSILNAMAQSYEKSQGG